MFQFILIALSVLALIVLLDCFLFFTDGKRFKLSGSFGPWLMWILFVINVFFFVSLLDPKANNCCDDSAFFSPDHKLSIYALIGLSTVSLILSHFRKNIFPPIPELLINIFLIIGIAINVFMIVHLMGSERNSAFLSLLGNLPIICMLLTCLKKNHDLALDFLKKSSSENETLKIKWFYSIIQMNPWLKFPLLGILSAPVLAIYSSLMLLFGQKPDSLIRAFTDTYFYGLSQWNHMCDNVICGGHFLCSVAALGDKKLVKPIRFGVRGGAPILCNRQLLVSNAFEEWLEDNLPLTHRVIRRNYNKVGSYIHKHYGIFQRRTVSNSVYLLMKPLEWCFLFFLYCVERNPENRIAKQYLERTTRDELEKCIATH